MALVKIKVTEVT